MVWLCEIVNSECPLASLSPIKPTTRLDDSDILTCSLELKAILLYSSVEKFSYQEHTSTTTAVLSALW